MNEFEEHKQSVTMYAHGVASFDVFFPEGHADCRHCQFCRYNEPFNLFKCVLTHDYIEKSALNHRHQNCPIKLDEVPF